MQRFRRRAAIKPRRAGRGARSCRQSTGGERGVPHRAVQVGRLRASQPSVRQALRVQYLRCADSALGLVHAWLHGPRPRHCTHPDATQTVRLSLSQKYRTVNSHQHHYFVFKFRYISLNRDDRCEIVRRLNTIYITIYRSGRKYSFTSLTVSVNRDPPHISDRVRAPRERGRIVELTQATASDGLPHVPMPFVRLQLYLIYCHTNATYCPYKLQCTSSHRKLMHAGDVPMPSCARAMVLCSKLDTCTAFVMAF